MKYINYNWTLALKIFNWKEKENARLPNTYGARLYSLQYDPYQKSVFSLITYTNCYGLLRREANAI